MRCTILNNFAEKTLQQTRYQCFILSKFYSLLVTILELSKI